jgi:hypothetical protein
VSFVALEPFDLQVLLCVSAPSPGVLENASI